MITGLADWADLPDRLEVVAALAHGEVSLPLFRLCRATARALDAVVADPAPRRDRVPGKVPRAVRVSGLVADVTQQELGVVVRAVSSPANAAPGAVVAEPPFPDLRVTRGRRHSVQYARSSMQQLPLSSH